MHLAGPKGPTEERKAELFGGLYLVGTRGKCCAILTERQLTIERFDGRGLRLNLAAIERMRHLKVPILPSGTILLGVIAIYLGVTTIVSPLSWLSTGAGVSAIIANFLSRYSMLAIETGAGGRHLISGSEGNLLKLCLMVDRVRHGSDLEGARSGLEELETEMPTFPSIRDAKGLLVAPKTTPQQTIAALENSRVRGFEGFPQPSARVEKEMVEISLEDFSELHFEKEEGPDSIIHQRESFETDSRNAYERAWGVESTPSWYQEKEIPKSPENRMDSAITDAAQGLDMFAPGGIFDTNIPTNSNAEGNFGEIDNSEIGSFVDVVASAPQELSSSAMIKRAHTTFGVPEQPFSKRILPPPTNDAVRDECRAGVVRQARARQELRVRKKEDRTNHPANLEEYPALNKLANSMGSTRMSVNRPSRVSSSTGWIGRLLSPSGRMVVENEKGEERQQDSGISPDKSARFQSAQHMRLRSDQDHQAEVGARIRGMRSKSEASSAKDALDSLVSRINCGKEDSPRLLDSHEATLRFSQLRPTSSKDDPHPLPGLKRLG